MPYYASSDDLYTVMRALFERMAAEGRLDHVGGRMRLRINISQPEAHTVINTRTHPPQVTFGDAAGPFDLEMSMTGDTLHLLWTRKLGVRESLGKGLIKIKGLPLKALGLKPLFDSAADLYPAVLRENGRAP